VQYESRFYEVYRELLVYVLCPLLYDESFLRNVINMITIFIHNRYYTKSINTIRQVIFISVLNLL
jgi:hypothetical protein